MDNSNQPIQAPQENHETLKVSASSDPHHFPKMLLIGLGAFLIIVIGGGIGYFLGVSDQPMPDQAPTPTPLPAKASVKVGDPTANWKTYSSKNFRFTFKYPQELYADEDSIGVYLSEVAEPRTPFQSRIVLNVYKESQFPGKLTERDAIGERKEIADKTYIELTHKLNIDGRPAIKIRRDVLPGSQTEQVPGLEAVISDEQNYIYLSTYVPQDIETSKQDYNEIFDQILSTFQFTP